jgi:hypothetical protein
MLVYRLLLCASIVVRGESIPRLSPFFLAQGAGKKSEEITIAECRNP